MAGVEVIILDSVATHLVPSNAYKTSQGLIHGVHIGPEVISPMVPIISQSAMSVRRIRDAIFTSPIPWFYAFPMISCQVIDPALKSPGQVLILLLLPTKQLTTAFSEYLREQKKAPWYLL